ncbi:unnamed protein product [Pylaiella littoralis]
MPTSSSRAAARQTSSSSSAASAANVVRFATAALALVTTAKAAVYNVSPDGNPMTLTAALEVAGAGDTISLGDGIYREPIVTMHAGENGNPLLIEGGKGAVINYFSGDRSLMWSQKVVDIRHSWITLRGFTIDGHLDDKEEEASFVDKCIWVEGQDKPTMVPHNGREVETSLIGTVIDSMKIENCGMECIRMRNWVTNSVITNNEIENCGIYDFRFQFDGKIGEAIYIGTSSNQWTDGPDGCNYNLVRENMLVPRGNECVDVKEGSTLNVIEYNDCAEQLDAESGCYDSRGNGNVFRYNTADQCLGAGIRLGGHVIDGFVYGVDNDVYGNDFSGTSAGSIKARQDPQGIICGNTCDESSGDCEVDEEGDDEEIDASWDQACPDSFAAIPFIDDDETEVPTPATPSNPSPVTVAPPTPTPTGDDDAAVLPEYEALGCFADTANGRVMSYKEHDPDLTTESCALECEGYKFFGTQYADECWCGGDETDHVQHGEAEVCDFECSGDASQICGGKWAMNVYQYAPVASPATASTTITTTTTTSAATAGAGDVACDGVLSTLGNYCCASKCGTCGGSGCSSRDGGASACCTTDINEAGVTCETNSGSAPCIVSESS